MTHRSVSRNFELAVLTVFLLVVLVAVAASQMGDWIKLLPAQRYSPPTVVLLKAGPPRALVCAEPEWGGTVSCLSVAELRALVLSRKAK